MRNFIDIVAKQLLTEARKKKSEITTASGESPKFDIMPGLEAGNKSVSKSNSKSGKPALPGKKAGASRTRQRAASSYGNASHPGTGEFYSQLGGMEDEMSDDEARRHADLFVDDQDAIEGPEPEHPRQLAIGYDGLEPNNDNLPAIVNKDIAQAGETRIQPEWHQVRHLPRYMQNAIRALARSVFRQFTETPIEEIQMIGTIPGLNSDLEVKAVMNWVRHNGVPEDEAEVTFPGNITAKIRLWKTEEFSFLLVQDFMGTYIYAWAGGRGVHVGHDDHKMIEGAGLTEPSFEYLASLGHSVMDTLERSWKRFSQTPLDDEDDASIFVSRMTAWARSHDLIQTEEVGKFKRAVNHWLWDKLDKYDAQKAQLSAPRGDQRGRRGF